MEKWTISYLPRIILFPFNMGKQEYCSEGKISECVLSLEPAAWRCREILHIGALKLSFCRLKSYLSSKLQLKAKCVLISLLIPLKSSNFLNLYVSNTWLVLGSNNSLVDQLDLPFWNKQKLLPCEWVAKADAEVAFQMWWSYSHSCAYCFLDHTFLQLFHVRSEFGA